MLSLNVAFKHLVASCRVYESWGREESGVKTRVKFPQRKKLFWHLNWTQGSACAQLSTRCDNKQAAEIALPKKTALFELRTFLRGWKVSRCVGLKAAIIQTNVSRHFGARRGVPWTNTQVHTPPTLASNVEARTHTNIWFLEEWSHIIKPGRANNWNKPKTTSSPWVIRPAAGERGAASAALPKMTKCQSKQQCVWQCACIIMWY